MSYKIGDFVKIVSDNDYYDSFKEKVLIVTSIATNTDEHRGYDESMEGMQLLDLKTKRGKDIPFSLYEYEIETT